MPPILIKADGHNSVRKVESGLQSGGVLETFCKEWHTRKTESEEGITRRSESGLGNPLSHFLTRTVRTPTNIYQSGSRHSCPTNDHQSGLHQSRPTNTYQSGNVTVVQPMIIKADCVQVDRPIFIRDSVAVANSFRSWTLNGTE